MPVPQAVTEAYNRSQPVIQSLANIVRSTIEVWTARNNYFFRGRVKSAASTAEKLETGRFKSWADLDDLYAAEIVVPTLAQVSPTLEYLQRTFCQCQVRGRGVGKKPPSEFRFDAVRFIGTLIPQEGVGRPIGVDQVLFEVQILTAFEYAWQVATHDSVYKGDTIDWRRLRLAAYLRASAEQADSLIAAFDEVVDTVPASPHPDTERCERIVRLCQREIHDEKLPEGLHPESWVRFGENVLGLVKAYAGNAIDQELDKLLAAVEAKASEGAAPVSGTLFQMIVSEVVSLKGPQALKRFPIVDSNELRDIYRIVQIPKRIVMV
jgi:hypothetical protein